MAVAGKTEPLHFLFETRDRQPGFASRRIHARIENAGDMIDEETPGLDQEPDRVRIAAVKRQKAVKENLTRFGQIRVMGDRLQ